jgi:hypothetical protein
LREGGVERAQVDQVVYEAGAADTRPLVGRLLARGLSDELKDRHYLVVDGVDGRAHYVEIGRSLATDPIPPGAVVRIEPRATQARAVDHTVAQIAQAHDGRYSVDLHLSADPTASANFAQAHVRRLEALRRGRAAVERQDDGTWIIGADHVEQAAAYEKRQAETAPVVVTTLSGQPIEQQVGAAGATWLDRELVSDAPEPLRDAGFGAQARRALALRRQWLIDQGLARQEQYQFIYRAGLLTQLQRRDLVAAAEGLARETGLAFSETRPGQRIEGVLRRRVDLASGRFAMIERSRDFTLVPWKPVLEGHEGRPVSGVLRGEGINWTLGRGRSGPSVS